MQVQGRTVVITGAGRGIGQALADRFGRDGAHVALRDVSSTDLDSVKTQLESAGVVARSYLADVAAEEQVVSAYGDPRGHAPGDARQAGCAGPAAAPG